MQPYVGMLYAGIVAGVISGTVWANAHGLDAARANLAMLLLVLPALLGARLLYVALHWPAYRRNPGRILRRSEGGAALYGGLMSAVAVSPPLLAALKLPLGAFWDAAAICLLVGMIFTKVGCLANGCCSGRVNRRWRVPLQLLEAALAALLLLSCIPASHYLPFEGALFLSAAAAYGAGRWALEPLRETVDRVNGLSVNRALSLGVLLLSTTGFLLGWLAR